MFPQPKTIKEVDLLKFYPEGASDSLKNLTVYFTDGTSVNVSHANASRQVQTLSAQVAYWNAIKAGIEAKLPDLVQSDES